MLRALSIFAASLVVTSFPLRVMASDLNDAEVVIAQSLVGVSNRVVADCESVAKHWIGVATRYENYKHPPKSTKKYSELEKQNSRRDVAFWVAAAAARGINTDYETGDSWFSRKNKLSVMDVDQLYWMLRRREAANKCMDIMAEQGLKNTPTWRWDNSKFYEGLH